MKKLSNTEAEWKNTLLIKKACITDEITLDLVAFAMLWYGMKSKLSQDVS